jgi:hypothetical protein
MLVGLVNKKDIKQDQKEKPSTQADLNKNLPPSKTRFSHLELKTKEITPLGSPRSIEGIGSEQDIGTLKRTRTANFMLDKDKQLNKFLTNAKLVNQATHIIDMGDQILYIGIIGKGKS